MKRDHRWNDIYNFETKKGMLNGKTVYILGSGTSLDGFDLKKLSGKIVMAINHSIEHYPEAQMLIFADKIFLHKTKFDLVNYKGLIFCSDKCKSSKPIDKMYNEYRKNLYVYEDVRDEPVINPKVGLFHPTSTGLQALNLAIQMRAKKIFLLGYDYYKNNGNMHFYPDYDHHKKYQADKMEIKVKKFRYFEQWEQKVINLSPESLVEEFKKDDWRNYFG